ncbi:MAG: NADH-quinone oxidoreductase subunit NuoE family protein, partial [Planctomycetota bacterium]
MEQNTVSSNKDDICAEEKIESKDILGILENQKGRGGLIAILEEIQAEFGFLPEEALRIVSEETGRSLVDIYGVATFYRFFSLQPKGKHLICACLGTACHVRGAPRIA